MKILYIIANYVQYNYWKHHYINILKELQENVLNVKEKSIKMKQFMFVQIIFIMNFLYVKCVENIINIIIISNYFI